MTLTKQDFEMRDREPAARARIHEAVAAAVKADPSHTYMDHLVAARKRAFAGPAPAKPTRAEFDASVQRDRAADAKIHQYVLWMREVDAFSSYSQAYAKARAEAMNALPVARPTSPAGSAVASVRRSLRFEEEFESALRTLEAVASLAEINSGAGREAYRVFIRQGPRDPGFCEARFGIVHAIADAAGGGYTPPLRQRVVAAIGNFRDVAGQSSQEAA